MTINEYLKELRLKKGLTQRGLALKMGVGNATISQIENHRNNPSLELLYLYTKALGADLDVMMAIMEGGPLKEERMPKNATEISLTRKIPLVGSVRAGEPILAIENIEGYISVDPTTLCASKDYFALRVQGDSMNELFPEDTMLVIEKTAVVESGQIAVVGINGHEATVKKVTFADDNIALIPQSNNPAHTPRVYNIEKDEISILGRVVQAIRYF